MNLPEPNDPLDALLREQDKHIKDNGFTACVVAALPHRNRHVWLRQVFLPGVVAIGLALAVEWLPWGNLPTFDLSALLSLNFQVLTPWVLVLSVMASLGWGAISALECED